MKKALLPLVWLFFTITTLFNTLVYGQNVPYYVPTTGLIGWWPFNGNANDESGNNNHGTPNGVVLTMDRIGKSNSAYSFNGTNSFIQTNRLGPTGKSSRTYSFWLKTSSTAIQTLIDYYGGTGGAFQATLNSPCSGIGIDAGTGVVTRGNSTLINNNWAHCAMIFDSITASTISDVRIYINGVLQSTISCSALNPNALVNTTNVANIVFGKTTSNLRYFDGSMDDIGIWNRALTAQEVTALYQACIDTFTVHPINASGSKSSNKIFTANISGTGNSYQWQSNSVGLGWQNVPNVNQYTGATSNSLTVNNLNVSNHNQLFRVVSTKPGCADTSNVATLSISDIASDSLRITKLVLDSVNKTNAITTLMADTSSKRTIILNLINDTISKSNIIGLLKADTTAKRNTITQQENTILSLVSDTMAKRNIIISLQSDTTTKGNRIRELEGELASKPDTLYIASTVTTDTLVITIRTGMSTASPMINKLRVFPNPAATILNIVLDQPGYYVAKLSNMSGQTLVTPTSGTIDISNLSNGVYLLSIFDSTNNLVATGKVHINK